MTTTISISEQSHRDLSMIKLQEHYKSMDDMVHDLIIEHRKLRLIKASERLHSRMEVLGFTVEDLLE